MDHSPSKTSPVVWVIEGVVALVCLYLAVRAAIEPFVVGDEPADYADSWGGPSLAGVLAVHMLPGVVGLAVVIWLVRRWTRRRRT